MPTITKLGKYLIRHKLGKGAMGVVYEGFDPVLARTVAIKTILPAQLDGSEVASVLARFKREAQAAGRLNHPGIVSVYEYGEVDAEYDHTVIGNSGYSQLEPERVAFIAMQFVKGRELRSYFDANERFALKDVGRIMEEILDALDHAHGNGVTHRDIKPANLIMLDDGRVKIADFGIARIESSQLTVAGTVMGTPSYMSPEQFQGQTVDLRSDLFSCGVILYQFLTGEKPFVGTLTSIMFKVLREQPVPPSVLNAALAPAWNSVVEKAIAKNPDDRFQSAQAFAAAIREVLASQVPRTPPVSHAPLALQVSGVVAPTPAPVQVPMPVPVRPTAPDLAEEAAFLTQADVSKALAKLKKEAAATKRPLAPAIPKAFPIPDILEIPKISKVPEEPLAHPPVSNKATQLVWGAVGLLLLAGAAAYLWPGSGTGGVSPLPASSPSLELPSRALTAPAPASVPASSPPASRSASAAVEPVLPIAAPSSASSAPVPGATQQPAPLPAPVPVPAAERALPPAVEPASESVKRPVRKSVVASPAPARSTQPKPEIERPPVERPPARSPRCALILQKAVVNEPISAEERNFLTSSCQ